jgi:hypothetical protein
MKELRARRVLTDCRWALTQYSPELSGAPLRVAWVGIVTLLRAVGHVVSKIDAEQNPNVDRIVKRLWSDWRSTKPDPAIFWEFIENERNSVLKQYEFGFWRTFQERRSEEGPVTIELRGVIPVQAEAQLLPLNLPDLKSLIVDGPFRGRSEREVAAEAIEWWNQTLAEIEQLAGLPAPS